AALRVAGVALAGIGLGENENASGRRERDRGAKPRDAAADDREVRPIGHRMLSYPGEFAGPQRTPAIVRHMEPLRIDVRTPSRAYAVTLGDGMLDRARRLLDDLRLPERRFIVSSPLVWRLHGTRAARALGSAEAILVPDGERFKQIATVSRIHESLIRAN